MSSPPASPGASRKIRSDKTSSSGVIGAVPTTPSGGKSTNGRKDSTGKPVTTATTKDSGKPKTKKELEAERLAAEEAERNKPPPTGSGQFEFPNGAIYDGEWQQFEEGGKKRHGQGRFTNGGEVYQGEWKEGQITGKGKYIFASGAWYEGEWVQNKFHGRGTYHWTNGASYIGDWVENKMHGQGAFLASTGDRYQGVFHNDRFQNAQGHWIAPMQPRELPPQQQ